MSKNANVPTSGDAELDAAQTDSLLGDAASQWKSLRAYVEARRFADDTYAAQIAELGKIDLELVDIVIADRGLREYAGVRYDSARGEVANVRDHNHQDRIAIVAGHVASVPLDRLRDLHRQSLAWLKRRAPKQGAVRVARKNDVRREWEATVQWITDTVTRPHRSEGEERVRRALQRIDAHLILLEGSKTVVPREYFRLSVAVASGLLT